MAKTQNSLIYHPRSEEFTIHSLDDFVDGAGNELLLDPIRAHKKYLSQMEQYHPSISNLSVSPNKRKKQLSRNTI